MTSRDYSFSRSFCSRTSRWSCWRAEHLSAGAFILILLNLVDWVRSNWIQRNEVGKHPNLNELFYIEIFYFCWLRQGENKIWNLKHLQVIFPDNNNLNLQVWTEETVAFNGLTSLSLEVQNLSNSFWSIQSILLFHHTFPFVSLPNQLLQIEGPPRFQKHRKHLSSTEVQDFLELWGYSHWRTKILIPMKQGNLMSNQSPRLCN